MGNFICKNIKKNNIPLIVNNIKKSNDKFIINLITNLLSNNYNLCGDIIKIIIEYFFDDYDSNVLIIYLENLYKYYQSNNKCVGLLLKTNLSNFNNNEKKYIQIRISIKCIFCYRSIINNLLNSIDVNNKLNIIRYLKLIHCGSCNKYHLVKTKPFNFIIHTNNYNFKFVIIKNQEYVMFIIYVNHFDSK